MSGNDVPALDAAQRAALSGRKPFVCECPPAWWTLTAVLAALPGPTGTGLGTVILVPELEEHDDLERIVQGVDALAPVHLATGIARSARLLRTKTIATLAATPLDLSRLVEMSLIPSETIQQIIVGWPEAYSPQALEACEGILAELAGAHRIFVTSDRKRTADFLERHARRAAVYPTASPGEAPNRGVIRYAIVPSSRRVGALRAVLDVLNPSVAGVWYPEGVQTVPAFQGVIGEGELTGRAELIVAMDLPNSTVLDRLTGKAEQVVGLIRATQLPHLMRMAPEAETIRLPSAADRARHSAHIRRSELREKLESDLPLGVLTTLEPLLDEFDPVLIAAAAISHSWQKPVQPDEATWTTIRIDKGKQDGLRAGDLVGALVNAVGLRPHDVGRIDLRTNFSLIEIRPEDAAKATRGLSGVLVRGLRISARLDDARRAGPHGSSSRSGRP